MKTQIEEGKLQIEELSKELTKRSLLKNDYEVESLKEKLENLQSDYTTLQLSYDQIKSQKIQAEKK